MNTVRYIIRFLLALIFVYAGIEKLFLPYNPSVFKSDVEMTDPKFFEFYDFLMGTGYLYFVGFFQLLNGLLLVFRRTYLLEAIMMIPLMLCLLMTHVFISRYMGFIVFDSVMFLMNGFLVLSHFSELKTIFLKPQTKLI
ncbi:DoxX family membrane protein [Tunicatimonas pelagia]|uniref:DoxX family membrane protein n=1 Tax=Tunicatimonas pelagia TaxID=931531 RepID=UPI002665AB92|nr:DoxX family membrane protein [Tunicatimonas pelagia]WKN42987.1 DoxX family membrane protein [Tunicatimonas pelagia]